MSTKFHLHTIERTKTFGCASFFTDMRMYVLQRVVQHQMLEVAKNVSLLPFPFRDTFDLAIIFKLKP
jgi:hypothetical protein